MTCPVCDMPVDDHDDPLIEVPCLRAENKKMRAETAALVEAAEERLRNAVRTRGVQMGGGLAPSWQKLADALTPFLTRAREEGK